MPILSWFVESRTKGTLFLHCGDRFYKVLKMRSKGDNIYAFKCEDLETEESREFQFRMLGLLEPADRAFSIMKSPRDIFFIDLDNNGKWTIKPKTSSMLLH